MEEKAKETEAAGSAGGAAGTAGQGADVTDLRSLSEDTSRSPQPEPTRARTGRGWPIAAVVLLLLLVGSLALNWMLYRGGSRLADEASGLGRSLAAANLRADRAERALEDLQGVVGNVHQSVLSLQETLGELATVTAAVAAPAESLAAEDESAVEAGEAPQSRADEAGAAAASDDVEALASVEVDVAAPTETLAAEAAPEEIALAPEAAALSEGGPFETGAPDVAAGPEAESPSLLRRVARGTRDKLRGLWPN